MAFLQKFLIGLVLGIIERILVPLIKTVIRGIAKAREIKAKKAANIGKGEDYANANTIESAGDAFGKLP